ncbi:MAG: abortive infection family protein [Sphingomonadales bacterium]|nr:abortive infection family protein [Sphingomonadales bacterium]NCO47686.1 abortive infection family protein [Sphingomonadales bacterium]NCP00223.1 abortive infection family protein [Sphingomonadales bacterium]NCP26851.1 abortive infection family protein [Sphingomonadales bacterium]NCP44541.1 abortive infection family protein [Sphingomonadales bacterium]
MNATPPADLVKSIRTRTAEVIAGAKAYDVPALCVRLGLSEGTEDEAMHSKFKYAHSRLMEMSPDAVLKAARALLTEEQDFDLAEHLAKTEEIGTRTVSTRTRRRVFHAFQGHSLCTEYDEVEFLEKLFPLSAIRTGNSTDWEQRTLRDDFIQHWVRNDDWTYRDLGEKLGLVNSSKALLFRFLELAVHPETLDEDTQAARVAKLNDELKNDGFRLTQSSRLSGYPVYKVEQLSDASPSHAIISGALARFNPDQIHVRWEAALDRRATDPAGAITLARTLLEDVCRWLLAELNVAVSDQDDLPSLYRKLSKALKLAPDDHSEQVFKQILGSCQSVVESLGALRNKLGDAHGGGPKKAKPAARHAELAVNLSGSMATFLVATWEARQSDEAKPKVA